MPIMELDAKLLADLSRFLPADLLNQLPERQAMGNAIQRLGSLYTNVSSFLPLYIVEDEERLTHDSGDLRPGTFMFADVSGFTALSEKLQAAGGSEGVEILTQIINNYFAKMLEIIAKSDGVLLKFAGDALLAFFPERRSERMDEAEKAIRTGLRMQRSMQEFFQPIQNPLLQELFGDHNLELTMSIGISRGKLFEALVGNTLQRDHIIQGILPGMAEAAEGAGVRDDVIVDMSLFETFRDEFTMRDLGDGFYQVVDDLGDDLGDFEFHIPRRRRASSGSLFSLVETDPIEELQEELERVQAVACFVAPEVVNKLAITAEHVTSENRPATVIFGHVTGFSEMLDAWGDEELDRVVQILSRFYNIVQRIIASYGGVLTRTDPYKDGFKMLITFGAPVAHPDDPQRAITTALEILKDLEHFNERLLEELPEKYHRKPFIKQRFGITHGNAFAGEAGWRARREYTVMGDDVNLAARLMGKSEFGTIYVNARVYKRAMDEFVFETLEPMALKGKSNVIQAYQVIRSRHATTEIPLTSDTPFIGRDLLMLSLTEMLNRAIKENARGAVTLHAPAGTGKTRTAQQLSRSAQSSGFKVAWSSCQLQNDRKTTWATLFAQLLDIEFSDSGETRRQKLDTQLQNLNLSSMRPALIDLMSDVLGSDDAQKASQEVKPASLTSDDVEATSRGKSVFDLEDGIEPLDPEASRIRPPAGLFAAISKQLTPPEVTVENGGGVWDNIERLTSLEEAVVAFLTAYCKDNPTMLIIDDVHDMDPYTLDVMMTILRRINQAPLVVVGTTEPGIELSADFPQMMISDLTEDETFTMATKILKANELGPNLARFLWRSTSGRPFYVESLLHGLRLNHQITIQQGYAELRPDVDEKDLPDDIRELIFSQVDRMSPEKQEILRVAAVLETDFTEDILRRLCDRQDEEALNRDLTQLVQEQMLERVADGTFRFRHGVTRNTMYDNLSRYDRQKLHRAVADYWMNLHETRYLFTIAHHLVKAGAIMRALEMIQRAADDAEESQDLERAIELYTRAQELMPNDETISRQLARLKAVKARVTQ